MYLLYSDESGAVSDPNQNHFVLAGVAIFERETHWAEQDLNAIAARFRPQDPYSIELHGSPMLSGNKVWRKFSKQSRIDAIIDALNIINTRKLHLFCNIVLKSKISGNDPVEHTFEQLSSRFDLYLRRLYLKYNKAQRGIIIFDKATTEQRIQTLAREFKYSGHTWGQLKNYAEVPAFLDSKASRLIQLADLVAFSMFRYYERNDNRFYNVIQNAFDSEGGVQHGLYINI
jgi:hypothetical protein